MRSRVILMIFLISIILMWITVIDATSTRTDTLTTNETISQIYNATWASGNVTLRGEPNKVAFNISENNFYRVTLTESTSIKGIANDGTYVYVNDAGARIKKVLFNGSVVSTHTISNLAGDSHDLANNAKFLYSRNGNTMYLINLTANSSVAVTVDSEHPIVAGRGWLTGNIVDMPDRRMGIISDSGTNPIILRLYNVSENGTYWEWSQDYNIASSWATDNHGIVSDGDSLVLISFEEGHRIFSLVNLSLQSQDSWNMRPSGIGNPTFITYDHVTKKVLIGDYGDSDFAVYNGSYSVGNFTSTTTETSATILGVTNVTWNSVGDTLGSTIRLQVSPNNGTTWYLANNGQSLGTNFSDGNRSLVYRVIFTTSSGANLTISNISIQWVEDSLSITINAPTNRTYNNSSIIFNVSLSEEGYAWGSLDNGVHNITLSSSNNLNFNFTNTSISDGSYTFIIYANSSNVDHNGTFSSTVNFSIYTADVDNDGLLDNNDTLIGNESHVNATGVNDMNITVSGNTTNGTFSGVKEVIFLDSQQTMINFTHNFSSSNIDLRQVTIKKSENYIILNFSGQLQGNKTVYLTDNNFAHLCVKDADIESITDISTSCDALGEINFDSCINSNATISGISCNDDGARIRFDNLTHSAIRGIPVTTSTTDTSGGWSGGGGLCTNEWVCSSWSFCSSNFTQTRNCELKQKNSCTPQQKKPSESRACPDTLFDIKIEIKNKNLLIWNDLEAKVNLEEISQSNILDATITYKISGKEGLVYEEKETRAIPGILTFTKKIDTQKLAAGEYNLQVILDYGKSQSASSTQPFRIIAIKVTAYYFLGIIIALILMWLAYHEYKIRIKDEKIIRYLKKHYKVNRKKRKK